jgi:protein involved in ribonucleotide reduction
LYFVHIDFRQAHMLGEADGGRAFYIGKDREGKRTMLIAYDSRTGNVRKFVSKLNMRSVQIEESMTLDEPFVLVTYTTGFGQVPEKVASFLRRNHRRLQGVAASGNRNWGHNFALSADLVARQYGVPVLGKFELAGTPGDVQRFMTEVNAACGTLSLTTC